MSIDESPLLNHIGVEERIHNLAFKEGVVDEYAEEPSCTISRSALVVKIGDGECRFATV